MFTETSPTKYVTKLRGKKVVFVCLFHTKHVIVKFITTAHCTSKIYSQEKTFLSISGQKKEFPIFRIWHLRVPLW
jgi:hypothetical protein